MLRFILILTLFALVILPLNSSVVQTSGSLRRITTTAEQALNLNPGLSDDGRVIVFESSADLVNTGGGNSFRVIRSEVSGVDSAFNEIARSRAASVSMSNDGQRITFASTEDLVGQNADRNSEIYFFDSTELRQLTHTAPASEASRLTDGNFEPSISGDGRWIACSSNRHSEGVLDIILVDTSLNTIIKVTAGAGGVHSSSPKISADGSRIFFIQSQPNQSDGVADLLMYDIATRTTHLEAGKLEALFLSSDRAVSSDGKRVVYSASTGLNQTQVFLFDLRENTTRQLSDLGSRSSDVNLNPTISGDGKRVTFATRRRVTGASDGSVELYLIDLPTGAIEQVTNALSSATAEVVSSLNYDGSLVAFSFPRVLSTTVTDLEFANNSEIYLAALSPRPLFGLAKVANAATRDGEHPRVAPQSIAIITGTHLCLGTEQAKLIDGALPPSIRGTTVQLNGEQARLIFASPDEVIFVVPANVADGPAQFIVTNSEGFPAKAEGIISRSAPGIFSVGNQAIMINANTLTAAPFDPSEGDLRLALFATGVRNATQLSVTIGGVLVPVEAVVPTSLPGLDEVLVRVPAQLRGSGTVSILVKANDIDSNVVTTEISGSALRDIMINEILSDPPDGLAGDANHDGTRDSSADEFIELVNATSRDLDLSGYQLQTRALSASNDTLRHRFAPGTVLQAGTALVVFGGSVLDNTQPDFGGALIFRATTGGLSLNNSGGVVTLRDAGGSVVTSVTYGPSSGAPGDANQSITRAPDVTGGLVLHQSAAGSQARAFSPGTRVNGSSFLPAPSVSLVTISPSAAEVLRGVEVQFSAKAFDEGNHELSDVIFGWTSSNQSVVTIDSRGLVKAINAGHAEVTANGRGVQSSPAVITVVAPTPSPTPTPTPTPLPSPSPTPSPTPSPSPASSPSPSPGPTPSPTVTPSPTPTVTPTPAPNLPPLVISEFRTRGPNGASDEFVEIYNNSDQPVNASGMKIRGSSSSGTITTRLTINADTLIPGRGHFLATNSSAYSGPVSGDQSFTSGVANDGGLALSLPDDTIIDQVGLGPGSAFREGMHLSPLPSDANQSYERKPGGPLGSTKDTQDNFNDFGLLNPSDPQNTHSGSTPGPTPVPTPTVSPSPTPSTTPTPVSSPSPSPSPTVSPSPTPSPTPTPNPSPSPSPTPSPSERVVISQIFGGGGNSGAPFRNDFIELFNAGTTTVNLAGWSVQYASATATTWSVTNVGSVLLAPGQYYLIQEASGGTNGVTLPTPDATGTINLAAGAGKVALLNANAVLSGACPIDVHIVDMVGYGGTATCFEGSPAPAPSNSTAIVRANGGCTDSASNLGDFATTPPNPRNISSSFHLCAVASADFGPSGFSASILFQVLILTTCWGAPL
ncbi:MAG TPA: lamin tail domain-containing protein [Pyrinomonadaceae bacterium]|nr:lamin tail domain-containing protein [Pyrinomonadaceae bacterium]